MRLPSSTYIIQENKFLLENKNTSRKKVVAHTWTSHSIFKKSSFLWISFPNHLLPSLSPPRFHPKSLDYWKKFRNLFYWRNVHVFVNIFAQFRKCNKCEYFIQEEDKKRYPHHLTTTWYRHDTRRIIRKSSKNFLRNLLRAFLLTFFSPQRERLLLVTRSKEDGKKLGNEKIGKNHTIWATREKFVPFSQIFRTQTNKYYSTQPNSNQIRKQDE